MRIALVKSPIIDIYKKFNLKVELDSENMFKK